MGVPICKECEHYQKGAPYSPATCFRRVPTPFNPVTGATTRPILQACWAEREVRRFIPFGASKDRCGPDGKYWAARTTPEGEG